MKPRLPAPAEQYKKLEFFQPHRSEYICLCKAVLREDNTFQLTGTPKNNGVQSSLNLLHSGRQARVSVARPEPPHLLALIYPQ